MSKKDYIIVAKIIYDVKQRLVKENCSWYTKPIEEIADEFCLFFMRDNVNFNKIKFLQACGFGG